ncbi:MAG TPA: hypothetical protein VL154_18390 [Acetobacteraceae bacterium]|jgi:hypothetical protein|nr:hypothetical protein [Acetobacteraceae bacterium]
MGVLPLGRVGVGGEVLDFSELRQLTCWCRARRVQWQPGVADDGCPVVLLLARHGMMLLPDDGEWRLLDGSGRMIAAASGLSELLDALDAGAAEPEPFRPSEPAFIPAVSWTG